MLLINEKKKAINMIWIQINFHRDPFNAHVPSGFKKVILNKST